ncbi:MAG: bifunctional UDP-3-O-[3-hydroxymyristoyl] N-acetylglucosamine deacetylase/3-hydroxyacyl-ACP dehydratase [Ignavibacteriae bacterium]|nr:bifunctional UDP-3-O-[3-hydroxymyristoyl] N-acetylglucosamine deacetylase/3-hydroxyacyl-ACP dehydratase [Ignavibacteriota bacterium]
MADKQRTIKKPVSFSGVGLHTGKQSVITFHPASPNYGFRFIRTDLAEPVEIPALVDNVVDLSRGTTLGLNGFRVHTVEHVLAALTGLKVDNCKIELSGLEPPVGDGSSMPYVDVLLRAEFEEQNEDRNYFVIDETIHYTNDEKQVDIVALPTDDYRITVMIDYHNPALGSQHSGLFNMDREFVSEFAPARTFCFLAEIQMLIEQGLIKGGNLDNAIVIVDKVMTKPELEKMKDMFSLKKTPHIGSTGILNDIELRFKNEPARHKLLDMLGDLTLVGVPLKAQILAARPGHASNIEFAKKIRKEYLKKQEIKKHKVSISNDVALDIYDLLKIMPHRYPFLMIDKLVEFDAENNSVVGIKNVTVNEPFFMGHFPEKPIMPGVMICESMAQTGCLLLLKSIKDFSDKLVLFMGIKEAKFRKPVIPGDQLIMKVKMTGKKFNTYTLKGTAYVNGQIVAEAELSTAVVNK